MRSFTAICCLILFTITAAPADAPRTWQVDPPAMRLALDAVWRRIERRDRDLTARGLMLFATEGAAARYRPDRLDTALGLVRELQDRDSKSATFGNLRWYLRETTVRDRNAVEFVVQTATVLIRDHTTGLSSSGKKLLDQILRDAAEGMRRHRVGEGYTNIYLMKAANCLLLGEYLGDEKLADDGRTMLRRWFAFTADNGVPEYNSPTYTGVDLDCLALAARFARRAEDRRIAEQGLRLFWTEAAAHWFAPCERLGGSHSRDYDYLTGRGAFDAHAWLAGWLSRRPPSGEGLGNTPAVTTVTARTWRPADEWIRPLQREVPRMIHQRWGKESWQRAAHHVGRRFSVGSAGAAKAFDDKVLTVNLGGPTTPMVNYVMDCRDDPYGKRREVGKDGHAKALHLIPFVASAQDGAEVLFLASDDPVQPKHRRPVDKLAGLWSHLVLPTEVTVCDASGNALAAGALPPGAPIFLRRGDVTIGIQYLATRTCAGDKARVQLVDDGKRWLARRLTVTHGEGEAVAGRGTVALWLRAAEGLDDAGFARFARTFAAARPQVAERDGRFTLRVDGLNGPLRLDVDPARRRYHAVEAPNPPPAGFLLRVNDREVWRPVIAAALSGTDAKVPKRINQNRQLFLTVLPDCAWISSASRAAAGVSRRCRGSTSP
ncbi:MAG: hypothetical protein U0736_22005 [Gemmataceae bacterium]